MRRFGLLLVISLSLMLFAGSAMAFTLSTDFTDVTIYNTDLNSSTVGQFNDLVRWQIQTTGGNLDDWARQTPRSDGGAETSLLMYGFDTSTLDTTGDEWSLAFDFINETIDGTPAYSFGGTVYLGGLTGDQTISKWAPWDSLGTTYFFDGSLASNTDDWTHLLFSGTVDDNYDILYVAFKMGGAGEALRGIDNLEWNSGNSVVPNPEPSTILLLGAGLTGLAGVSWRRRKNG